MTIAKFLRTPISKKICESLLPQFLLLTVNISSQGLDSALNSIVSLQGPPQGLKGSPQGAQRQGSFLFEKKKNLPKWSLVRCHPLYHSLSLLVIRCHSLYHSSNYSLSFVVTLCITRCHSLSLDVPLACLLINDLVII